MKAVYNAEKFDFHTCIKGTSVFKPIPNAFILQTPALMTRRLAKPVGGTSTAIRLRCETRQKKKHFNFDPIKQIQKNSSRQNLANLKRSKIIPDSQLKIRVSLPVLLFG